jgi:hypothetical protein
MDKIEMMIKARIHLTEEQTKALQEAIEDYQTEVRVMEEISKTLATFRDEVKHPQCPHVVSGFATLKPLVYIRSNGKR